MAEPNPNFITPIIEQLQRSRSVLSRADVEMLHLPPNLSEFDRQIGKLEQQQLHSQNRYTLLLLGESNAGKSTILNVMFNLPEQRRLPVGDQPINAIPIRFTYWDSPKSQPEAEWIMRDGSVRHMPWQEALLPADQSKDSLVRANIREIVVRMEHPLLLNVDILDMPGTGSTFFDHTATTHEYLDTIDLVAWVIGFDEPDREGYRDLQIVRSTNVPMIVIFNAWGAIDPDINTKIARPDQDAFEQTILSRFRIPEDHRFRVAGRKCIEMMDSGRPVPAGFGMEALTNYLIESYLGDLAQRRIDRRNEVRAKVARNLVEFKQFLQNSLEHWKSALNEASMHNETFSRDEQKSLELTLRVAAEVARRADVCTRKVVDYLERELMQFIQDQLKLTNMKLYQHILDRKGMEEYLKREFEKRVREDYIKRLVDEYYKDCLDLLKHEWVKFIQDYDLDPISGGIPMNIKLKDLPLDRITNEALKQVRNVVGKALVIVLGLVVSAALFLFGPIIGIAGATSTLLVDTSALAPVVLGAATTMASKWKNVSPKDNIERIIRQDLESRRDDIKAMLVKAIIDGPQKEFLQKFAEQRDKHRMTLSSVQSSIRDGMRAVNDAIVVCTSDLA